MAEQVTTSRIVELLDNKQFIAALEAARQQEERLTAARVAGGRQGVAALKAVEAAARKQAQAIEVSAAAAQVATDSTGRMAAGMASLRSQIIDIGVSLQGGMNPLTILSQQGPQVAEALALMGPAAVAASAAFAPLLVALPILAGGYLAYSQRAEEAAEAQKKATEEAAEAQKVYKDLYAALTDASIEQAVLSGAMSETEAAQTRAAIAIGDRFGPALERAGEKLRTLRAELKEYEYSVGDGTQATEEERAKLALLRVETEKAETDYDRLAVSVRDLTDAQTTNIEVSDRQTEARKRSAKAAKDEKKAIDDLEALIAGVNERLEGWHPLDGLTEMDKAGLFDNVETFEEAQIRIAKATMRRAQAQIDAEEAVRQANERARQSSIEGAESLHTASTDAADAIADATAESTGRGAQAAFLASQALGYSQAAIGAAKVGVETAASFAANPLTAAAAVPLGVAAGAAALAAFAVPIASQQPPTFSYNDTPGVTQVGPSSRAQVDLKEGDLFLAAQSMDGLTAQLGAMLARQGGNTSRRPRRSRLRDRLAINPLELFEVDMPRAVRGRGR